MVCDSSKSKIQILDFFEWEGHKLKPEVFEKNLDYKIILKQQLEKLKNLAPQLASQYLDRSRSIESEMDFKKDHHLVDIEDSLHLSLPSSCKLKQIAIRKGQVLGEEKRFVMDQDSWNKLDEVNKAGLILHEVIYEHLVKLNRADSRIAREINRVIFSSELSKMKKGQFWNKIHSYEIPIYP